jgi:rRNA-processing protein FCF1
MTTGSSSNKKTTVYLPPAVIEELHHVARRHRRSFNSELIWALEQYLNQQGRDILHLPEEGASTPEASPS